MAPVVVLVFMFCAFASPGAAWAQVLLETEIAAARAELERCKKKIAELEGEVDVLRQDMAGARLLAEKEGRAAYDQEIGRMGHEYSAWWGNVVANQSKWKKYMDQLGVEVAAHKKNIGRMVRERKPELEAELAKLEGRRPSSPILIEPVDKVKKKVKDMVADIGAMDREQKRLKGEFENLKAERRRVFSELDSLSLPNETTGLTTFQITGEVGRLPSVNVGTANIVDLDGPTMYSGDVALDYETRLVSYGNLWIGMGIGAGGGHGEDSENKIAPAGQAIFSPNGGAGVGINAGPLNNRLEVNGWHLRAQGRLDYRQRVPNVNGWVRPGVGLNLAYGQMEFEQEFNNTFGGGLFEHRQTDDLNYFSLALLARLYMGFVLSSDWQLWLGGAIGPAFQHWNRDSHGCGDGNQNVPGCDGAFYNTSAETDDNFIGWSGILEMGLATYFWCTGGETKTALGKCAALSMGLNVLREPWARMTNPTGFGQRVGLEGDSRTGIGGTIRLIFPLN
ncbi:MAG: hypothetical protein H6907_14205 [Hyphomicrobiales bacterium]|nr:hypothetical protein [Hyphomicrobiales bacterium]